MRFGMDAVILGGGGEKGKETRAYQDDEKLNKEANLMVSFASDICRRLEEKDIYWSADGKELEGNL